MSPERTSHATSLPVRADRSARGGAAPADDTFATLLGAQADRPESAGARRNRGPVDDRGSGRPDGGSRDDHGAVRRDREPVNGRRRANGDRDRAWRREGQDRRPDTPPSDQLAASTPAPTAQTPASDPQAAAARDALLGLMLAAQQAVPAPAGPPTPATGAQQATSGLPSATPLSATPDDAAGVQIHGADDGAAAATAGAPMTAGDAAATTTTLPDPSAQPAAADARPAEPAALPTFRRAHADDRPADPPVDAAAPAGASATPQGAAAQNAGGGTARQGDGRSGEHRSAADAAPVTQAAPPSAGRDLPSVTPPTTAPTPTAAQNTGTASLAQAPRAVGQLIHLATQSGVQRARMNLRPAELGGIEIRLQSTAAGVSAQVIADSPQAARLLQQASDDLRRSLASQDVQLLSLDVSTSDQDRRDPSAASSGFGAFGEPANPGRADRGRPQTRAGRTSESDSVHLPTTASGTVLELPDGVLVDVLA